MKTINPYQRLLEEIKDFCLRVKYPKRIDIGWFYPKKSLADGDGFPLQNLYYHVQAAEKLGYDSVLRINDQGLTIVFVEKKPDIPREWR